MNSASYRPEIDGLRAFAVIPVILFHLGCGWISGGFIGVDVFFVISGFLITSIITKQLADGTFSFRGFWARRIRRILPVSILMIATTLCVSAIFQFKGDQPALGEQGVASLLSVANLWFWRSVGDYWGSDAAKSPFLHTWSLSVEEQFYIVFPVAVWLVAKYRPAWLRAFLLLIVVCSLGVFLCGTQYFARATFYLLPTRAWELATGCYLAIDFGGNRNADSSNKTLPSLAFAGLCLICISYFTIPQLNGGVAISILGTSLVLMFARSGICYQILSNPVVVYIGKISYSLYIWHWPVVVFANQFGYQAYPVVLFAIIFVMSMASYHFVETPTRSWRGVLPYIGVSYVATLCFAAFLARSSGLYDTTAFAQPVWYDLYYDMKPRTHANDRFFQKIRATTKTPAHEAPADAYLTGGVISGEGEGPPRMVLLGDSHGVMWSKAFHTVAEDLNLKTSLWSMTGVSPFIEIPLRHDQQAWKLKSDEKYNYDSARLQYLKEWKPAIVVISTRWSTIDAAWCRDLLDFLQEINASVFLLEQPPELAIGECNALQYLCYKQMMPDGSTRQFLPAAKNVSYDKGRQLIEKLSAAYHNCKVLPVCDLYLRESDVLCLDGNEVVYVDDDHLTTYGTMLAVPRIKQMITDRISEKDSHLSDTRMDD